MIDITDLWIGDTLKIISTGQIGTYEGQLGPKIILNTPSGQISATAHDLEIYTAPVVEEKLTFDDAPTKSKVLNINDIPKSIDLHIEKLSPTHTNALPERILAVQLEALNNYLDKIEMAGLHYITIIHGKGTGVLKSETIHILKGRSSVKHWIEVHQGGAMEVLMTHY